MPDILETIARGIHRADEMKGAPPWEEQLAFVKEAQMERAQQGLQALLEAGIVFLPGRMFPGWSADLPAEFKHVSAMEADEFRVRAYRIKIEAEAAMKEGAHDG